MPRIIHYRNKCIGCNACAELLPSMWRMSRRDGKSVLLKSIEKKGVWTLAVDEEEYAANAVVAKMCPSRIIQLRS